MPRVCCGTGGIVGALYARTTGRSSCPPSPNPGGSKEPRPPVPSAAGFAQTIGRKEAAFPCSAERSRFGRPGPCRDHGLCGVGPCFALQNEKPGSGCPATRKARTSLGCQIATVASAESHCGILERSLPDARNQIPHSGFDVCRRRPDPRVSARRAMTQPRPSWPCFLVSWLMRPERRPCQMVLPSAS